MIPAALKHSLPDIERLAILDEAGCARLVDLFTALGFTPASTSATEGIGRGQFEAMRLPLIHDFIEQSQDRLLTVVGIFVYAQTMAEERVIKAFGTQVFDDLVASGILITATGTGPMWRTPFLFQPFDRVWVLSDVFSAGGDAVMGPGRTTAAVMRMAGDLRGHSVLDVGCGAGSMALLAAKTGAARAIGVDINARALRIAAFNARLNQVAVEWRQGDLLAPVQGEHFTRILCQPPYVVAPQDIALVTYLHAGPTGDELAMRLLTGIPANLAETGRALVLFDYAQSTPTALDDRIRALVGAGLVNVLVLATPGIDADLEAIAYATLEYPQLDEHYAQAAVRYRRHLARLGIKNFLRVAAIMEKPSGTQFYTALLPVGTLSSSDISKDIGECLEGMATASLVDADLLRLKLSIPAQWSWSVDRVVEKPNRHRLSPPAHTLFQEQLLNDASGTLLEQIDGSATVADAMSKYAQMCECPVAEVQAQVLGFIRGMLAKGVLRRVPLSTQSATPLASNHPR